MCFDGTHAWGAGSSGRRDERPAPRCGRRPRAAIPPPQRSTMIRRFGADTRDFEPIRRIVKLDPEEVHRVRP